MASFVVGDVVQGMWINQWLDANIVAVDASGTVTVKWHADNTLSKLNAQQLRRPGDNGHAPVHLSGQNGYAAGENGHATARIPGVIEPSNAGPPLSKPSFDLAGKNFIVTGGTQGLGLEIARQLKACGAAGLALLSRTKSKGEAAAQELSGGSCRAFFVEADMGDPSSLQAAGLEAIKVLGDRVDGLVNAAGTTERGNLMTTTVEMFDKQFNINTRAPFLLTQTVSKHMIEKKIRGSVVNIGSIASKGGAPFICAYSASKAALNCLTKNNAAELAPYGIRVNSVDMGWTLTENENALMEAKAGKGWLGQCEPGLPMKRIMRPVDVACTALFLLSPASQMMTGNILDLHPDTALGMLSLKTEDSIER